MPDQDVLRDLRARRTDADADLQRLGVEIRDASDTLAAALRRADQAGAAASGTELDTLRTQRLQTLAGVVAIDAGIEAERDSFDSAEFPDLASRITRLGADLPIALLPLRIETRFLPHGTDQPTDLWIRIYPDDVHVDAHEPELTAIEVTAADRYWLDVTDARGDSATIDAAWSRLAEGLDPNRAEWIARITQPEADGSPVLDRVARKDGPWTRAPMARALPERFVAMGYVAGKRVFTQWGQHVADRLAIGPEPDLNADDTDDRLGAPPAEQPDLAIDDGMRWLADLDAAERQGMAIRVELTDGFRGGLDRLVVLGVRCSDEPAGRSELLMAQIQSHRFTEGLAVLRPGAPTNNTGAERSAATSARPSVDPLRTRIEAGSATAGGATAAALGLDPGALDDVAGADRVDHAGDMLSALWWPTLGYYAEQLLIPLLSDREVDRLGHHFVTYVRGRGPLPALRVGSQPYGLLPVLPPDRLQSDPTEFPPQLLGLLGRLRGFWRHAARDVPRLGRTGDPVRDLVEVLGMSPTTLSLEGRPVVGRHLLENLYRHGEISPLTEARMEAQRAVAEMLLDAVGVRGKTVRLATMPAVDTSYPIRRPFVQRRLSETAPPRNDFVRALLAELDHPDTVRRVRSLPPPEGVLDAMLRVAALSTMGNVATSLHLVATGRPSRVLMEAEFVDVEGRQEPTETSLRLVDRPVDGVTGGRTVAEVIAADDPDLAPHLLAWKAFKTGLTGLVDVPSAELHRLFADALDVVSHRLDAWCTSLATRRLDTMREAAPRGIHLGAFGFVEDLRPTAPETVVVGDDGTPAVELSANAGYVHAPSLVHASTAAILRSGFLAHGGNADAVLALDLSSARIRTALDLIRGVREGERLAAVLGYRIERTLRERELGQYIAPLRVAAPLHIAVGGSVDELEAAIGGAVVDGERVLELAENGAVFGDGPEPFRADDPNRGAVESVLDGATDMVDALADLLLAETVHQTVRGDPASASAALAAIDYGAHPPEPDVARTPRTGVGITHRLAVVIDPSTGPAAGWPTRARSVAEPAFDRWAGSLLGAPDRVLVRVLFPVGPADGIEVTFTLADVGVAALDVVLGMQRGSQGASSELEARLLRHARSARPQEAPTDVDPVLHPERDDRFATGDVSLAECLELAAQIGRVLAKARPATGFDLAAADEPGTAGLNTTALRVRSGAVEAAFRAAVTDLRNAVDGGDQAAVDVASASFADFGVPGSLIAGSPVLAQAEALLAAHDEVEVPAGASEEDETAAHVARIELLAGAGLRVLPPFLPANPAELAASRAQSAQLQGGDPLQAAGWLAHVGLVREGAELLATAVLLTETVSGTDAVVDLAVVQLPFADGDRWVAMPFEDDRCPTASVALVLHDRDHVDFTSAIAGLVLDEWTEATPRGGEITGLSFHYDQPDATAPNVILIGVHPGDAATWDLDTLEAIVLESMDLTHIRAVDTDLLQWLGRYLPMIYLPDNLSSLTASLDLLAMAARELD